MPQRQRDGIGGTLGMQPGDGIGTQHLVVIQECDPVMAALVECEGARLLNRGRPGDRNHLVGKPPCYGQRLVRR